jgi:glycosyltransferase involved in cell wall biosynthesis
VHNTSKLPLVSVVTASYNMGQYLPQAVQSVLAQTYSNVEVVVIDDGSTDDTQAICAQWAQEPRVRVHRQVNSGQAKAKNKGVELGRGEFVAFLDADDLWLPDKLERQMPRFEGRPSVGVVYSDYECMDGAGKPLHKNPTHMYRGRISGKLLIENFVSFPSAIVRRDALEKHGAFDETFGMGIDYDLWLRLSAHYDFDFVEGPTIRYRVWEGQMSKNYRKRYQSAIGIMQRFLDAHPALVPATLVDEAWAHTYVGRGDSVLWNEGNRKEAMSDYLLALRFRATYWPAWRAILRSLITLRKP